MCNKRIHAFVENLANQKVFENTTNQFSYDVASNEIRRNNLIQYLLLMYKQKPKVLLVSEAPGYLGMKLTGVPFSSERTLLTHPFYSSNKKIKVEFNGITEQSATIVWNVLDATGYIPLMFPAFPFHPNKAGNPESNRPPTDAELAIGEKYLKELVEFFCIKNFLAVGRKAESTLLKMNICAPYVRHPANGGSNKFRAGLEENKSMFFG
jgi:uracil-DNA glycosylase